MITGCLQQKNGLYYAVLYLKIDGKRKTKWVPTKLPVKGTSERKARNAFEEIRSNYEREEEQRIAVLAIEKEEIKKIPPDARLEFTEYLDKWLAATRPTIAIATYQSYKNLICARVIPYFKPKAIRLYDITPQHIEDFYQSILADNCTTNTVIHYHAIIRKALQAIPPTR